MFSVQIFFYRHPISHLIDYRGDVPHVGAVYIFMSPHRPVVDLVRELLTCEWRPGRRSMYTVIDTHSLEANRKVNT